jgi:ribosome recycling factor
VIKAIEKAIQTSDLNLNPSNDGKIVRIPIPPLSEERRKQLTKVVHEITEEHRTAIRNIRRDANDDLKKAEKDGAINQDEHKRMEGDVQKITDEAIKRIDEALKTKEQEIMHV